MTFAESEPAAAPPVPSPKLAPFAVTYRGGDFTFADNDDPPKPSHVDGRQLAEEILGAWEQDGLIRRAELAEPDARWPGDFFYALTFTGTQRNDSNFWIQGFNTLTLFLLPYTVTHHYEIECVVEDVATGARYTAKVTGQDETWVTLPLLLAFPFRTWGHQKEMAGVADRLYEALAKQGAFSGAPAATPTEPSPVTDGT